MDRRAERAIRQLGQEEDGRIRRRNADGEYKPEFDFTAWPPRKRDLAAEMADAKKRSRRGHR